MWFDCCMLGGFVHRECRRAAEHRLPLYRLLLLLPLTSYMWHDSSCWWIHPCVKSTFSILPAKELHFYNMSSIKREEQCVREHLNTTPKYTIWFFIWNQNFCECWGKRCCCHNNPELYKLRKAGHASGFMIRNSSPSHHCWLLMCR